MPRSPATAAGGGLWQAPLTLGFAWGFAEATLFFIIPDVIIGWAALSGWRSGLRMLLAAISGALAGGLVLYAVATARPAAALAAVEAVPFVHHAMIERVAGDYRRIFGERPSETLQRARSAGYSKLAGITLHPSNRSSIHFSHFWSARLRNG